MNGYTHSLVKKLLSFMRPIVSALTSIPITDDAVVEKVIQKLFTINANKFQKHSPVKLVKCAKPLLLYIISERHPNS